MKKVAVPMGTLFAVAIFALIAGVATDCGWMTWVGAGGAAALCLAGAGFALFRFCGKKKAKSKKREADGDALRSDRRWIHAERFDRAKSVIFLVLFLLCAAALILFLALGRPRAALIGLACGVGLIALMILLSKLLVFRAKSCVKSAPEQKQ